MKIKYDIDTTVKFYQMYFNQKEERASRLKNRAKDRSRRTMHWNRQQASKEQAVLA
ncbi:hypothetical protein [Stenotrophomonas sp. Ste96]|uniref:hypothetical protein n=1 Tax=Stenotrophomonas sp. Ste96 TaxID=2926029 RepID=UPI0021C60A31|nr:hypothetical protein [Stenotrophomonas sp. Ste96]